MLSIIISSYNNANFLNLEANIAATCGIDYEIIRVENPGTMSINAAYNQGIAKSHFDYLLFIHEDVIFETQDWGSILLNLFIEQPRTGLIGVAGTKFKTKAPSGWGESGKQFNEVYIKQYNGEILVEDFTKDYAGSSYKEVAVLDGVFLATRKSNNLFFDETLDGFHNYDIALSLRNREANKMAIVSFEIIIRHLSTGNYGHEWVRSTFQFYKKYKNLLPFALDKVSNSSEIEKVAYYNFYSKCVDYKELRISLYFVLETFIHFPFSRLPYVMLLKSLYRLPHFFKTVRS